jgi:hypothetical protein
MSTIGTTLFSKIEINGQEVDIATLDANDGIYALPAGQTTANVKFTMIDNTSIPRGVFEENSYITAMTLPDAMTYIASYSFHGVNNINISDKNAILAINPYAFDAEPGPTPPTPTTDPDIYFMSPTLTVDYNMEPNKLNGNEITQYLSGSNSTDGAWIVWSTDNSSIATVNHGGYVIANGNGTVNIIAEYTAHDNYNSKTVQYQLTITNYSGGGGGKTTPYAHWYENGTELSELVLVQGGSETHTLTFSATPSDSWSFMDPMFSGISVDTTTGTITITESNLNVGNISISANRSEDSSYYYGSAYLSIRVLTTGSDPKFYYEQESVNLDNQGMTTSTPMLHDEYIGLGYTKTYASADTNVATVDAYGMISFVGAGNTTVTATTTNGTDTHTATINVYCSVMKQTPHGNWIDPSTQMSSNMITCAGGTTIQFTGTPSTGWTFTSTIPMIDQSTGQITVPTGDLSGTQYTVNASYTEDATYYSGSETLTITIS